MRTKQYSPNPVCLIEGANLSRPGVLLDLRADFDRTGALLFRGMCRDRSGFRGITELFCEVFVRHPSSLREAYEDGTITRASPGKDHFFAHSELAYLPNRPDVAWFFCKRPAHAGGQTVIYDAEAVYRGLSPQAKALFDDRPLIFSTPLAKQAWEAMTSSSQVAISKQDRNLEEASVSFLDGIALVEFCPLAVIFHRASGRTLFSNSLLDAKAPRFADGEDVPRWALHEAIIASERVAHAVEWSAGDILMVDNWRFMHGRKPFNDSMREIAVRFGYLRS